MKKAFLKVLSVSLLLGLISVSGLAQESEKPELYVSIGWWDVPREQWTAFVQHYEKYELPIMQKMFDEGILLEYGFDAGGLHNPEGYTHSSWLVATSWGNIEKAMQAFYESLGADADRVEAAMAGMVKKHMDVTVQTSHYGSRPMKLTNRGYFNSSSIRVKRGGRADYEKLWTSWAEPVYRQLLADGVIVSYGLDTAYHHTSEDSLGRMTSWYVLENMDDEARVNAAFDSARAKEAESDRRARNELYWSLVVENSHRDDFTRIIHFQTK